MRAFHMQPGTGIHETPVNFIDSCYGYGIIKKNTKKEWSYVKNCTADPKNDPGK